jgi:hypothetical protein
MHRATGNGLGKAKFRTGASPRFQSPKNFFTTGMMSFGVTSPTMASEALLGMK